jgi:hypothetical protein
VVADVRDATTGQFALGRGALVDGKGSPVCARSMFRLPSTALLTTLLLLLAMAWPAAAAPPLQEGSGQGSIQIANIEEIRQAGGNSIQQRQITGVVTGDLDGTFVQDVRGVVHRNGQVTFQGTMTFTGTIGTCGEGTVTLGLNGKGAAGALPVTESRVRPIGQAGNTVAVVGQGTVSQDGLAVTYELTYRCR